MITKKFSQIRFKKGESFGQGEDTTTAESLVLPASKVMHEKLQSTRSKVAQLRTLVNKSIADRLRPQSETQYPGYKSEQTQTKPPEQVASEIKAFEDSLYNDIPGSAMERNAKSDSSPMLNEIQILQDGLRRNQITLQQYNNQTDAIKRRYAEQNKRQYPNKPQLTIINGDLANRPNNQSAA
jgi:hypothetical protein